MTTTPYKIVIPSYKRAETLRDKTLKLLAHYNIPVEKIHIFVANKEEAEIYGKTLDPKTFGVIIIGVPGMRAIRNFIQDWFLEGEYIVNIDDDIQAIKVRLNDYECKDLHNLDEFITSAFDMCDKKVWASLWGVYPMINPLFMHNDITLDLQYIIGAFWGVINTHDPETYVTGEGKEDFERTIKFYIRDNKVVRFNNVGIKTSYYTEPGGMQANATKEERQKEEVRCGRILLEKYPMFCEVNKARKRRFEIRLVDKRRKHGR